MGRASCWCALIAMSTSSVFAADAELRWEVFAGCAAAYQANWQNRLSDRSRPPEMSAMIQDTSSLYKLTAAGHYEKEKKASKDEANRGVVTYVETNIERFIAMDKAGTLEAYIESCPQPDEAN
jgi:hypothetical protein